MFAGIGFVEYATRHLFLNPKVIASNQFESYFRVNSLFFDPNIYGRFLVVVMVGVAAVLIWARRTRDVWLAAAVLAVLWAGLLTSLSQSSFAALLLGLCVLGGLRWSVRWALAAGVAVLAVGAVVALAAPDTVGLDDGADSATSGRVDLVEGGLRLFEDEPVVGHGSGSFSRAYRRAEDASAEKAVVGLAHDPGDDRRRAGRARARALRADPRRRLRPAAARRARRSGARRDRGRLRGPRPAYVGLRRLPRGPADLGAARHGHRLRARPRAPAAPEVRPAAAAAAA